AQGRVEAGAAALSGAIDAAVGWVERARLLPAHVEIALSAGDVAAARAACEELDGIARTNGRTMLLAAAAQARGAVELAAGDARAAAPALVAALAGARGAVRDGARSSPGGRGVPLDG